MKMEIIQAQIALLADMNRELAGQATPEAAREIRENVKLLLELAGAQVDQAGVRALEDNVNLLLELAGAQLEARLEALEEALWGDYGPEGFDIGTRTLAQFVVDCREDLDSIYDIWGPALDRHLGEDWCEDCEDEEAGE